MYDQIGQLSEDDETLLIAVVDETYGEEDEGWDVAREAFRLKLEKDYGLAFEEADIGPGASLPAFVALLDLAGAAASITWAAFLTGTAIHDGLEAWSKHAERLRKFRDRHVYFSRKGSAVLAVDEVARTLGKPPKSLRLLSYQVQHVIEHNDLAAMPASTEIQDAPATINLGAVRHILEIEADGAVVRISVEGQDIRSIKVDQGQPGA